MVRKTTSQKSVTIGLGTDNCRGCGKTTTSKLSFNRKGRAIDMPCHMNCLPEALKKCGL